MREKGREIGKRGERKGGGERREGEKEGRGEVGREGRGEGRGGRKRGREQFQMMSSFCAIACIFPHLHQILAHAVLDESDEAGMRIEVFRAAFKHHCDQIQPYSHQRIRIRLP